MRCRDWSVVRGPWSVVSFHRGQLRHPATDHGPQTTDRRRGFTLIELTVTMILLGVMVGTLVPLLGQAARVQRETDRRQTALYEAHNVLERLSARPWSELTAEAARNETLPESCRDALPGARLSVTVEDVDGEDEAKRIAVELAWTMRDGVEAAPVRLVTWRYRRTGTSRERAP